MPSPYGKRRGASTYYEYGGTPQHYLIRWDGMPVGSQRAAEARELAGDSFIDVQAHLRKELGDYTTHPVSMSMETGRRSVLHSGPEQTHLYDAPLGVFGLSRNEQRWLGIGAVVLGAYWLSKKYGLPRELEELIFGKKRRK